MAPALYNVKSSWPIWQKQCKAWIMGQHCCIMWGENYNTGQLGRNAICSHCKTLLSRFIVFLPIAWHSAMNQNSLQHSETSYAKEINTFFISNCKVVSGEPSIYWKIDMMTITLILIFKSSRYNHVWAERIIMYEVPLFFPIEWPSSQSTSPNCVFNDGEEFGAIAREDPGGRVAG